MIRYVVTRPYTESNVGSNLSSLAGAAWVASRLSRHLIVDWRGQKQLVDPSLNYFSEFFDAPESLGGVRSHYAPVDEAVYEQSSTDAAWLTPGDVLRLMSSAEDPGVPYLVLQAYHGLDRVHPGPESERYRLLRRTYADVQPEPSLAGEIAHWAAQHLDGNLVIGVNVRTGNGAYFGKGDAYSSRVDISVFEDKRRFLSRIERAIKARLRRLPKDARDAFVVFYATDSAPMSELLSALPHATTRRTVFPPRGRGDLYAFGANGEYTDRDSIRDTLADMFLLARCDALVYNNSLFNQYARVSRAFFGGNQIHLERLFLRQALRLQATQFGSQARRAAARLRKAGPRRVRTR